MIIDEFLAFVYSLINGFFTMLPQYDMPDYTAQAAAWWGELVFDLYKLNGFVPVTAIFQVFVSLIITQMLVVTIKVIRIMTSLATGGGGAT